MTDTPLLRTVDLAKSFGAVTVLKSINFDIKPAESVGLIGDNGAGKSTLVKILSGVYSPTGGRINFNGQEVEFASPLDARAAGIEMIYQDLALCDDLDAVANVFLGREIRTWRGIGRWLDRAAMRQETIETLSQLSSDIPIDQPVGSMSGGQRQLVAVARALQFAPKLLLMDEPTAALSNAKIHLLLEMVNRLKERGVAVLLISHRFTDLLSVCDRIIAMRDGVISAQIYPHEGEMADQMAQMQFALTGEVIGETLG